MRPVLSLVGVLVWTLATVVAAQQAPVDRKLWDGVYTTAQAARGKARFETSCGRCHNNELIGSERGPALKGSTFTGKWENDSLASVFTLIRDTMPRDGGAGVLADDVKIDILAYILQTNAFPSGEAELALDLRALEGIKFARRSVTDGIFSGAQAERGKAAFLKEGCTGCHQVDLSGGRGPSLKGAEFVSHWQNGPVTALFAKIRDTMPPNGPQDTSAESKIDIVSYLFQANGFPAGRTELRADATLLDTIDIVRSGVPAGVPNFALVQVVGCLAQGPDRAWLLTKSSEPVATRDEEPTPQLLSAAQTKALGSQNVVLVSATGFQPAANAGKKVEARGLIYKDGGETRLNLTSLQAVGQTCNN